MIGICIGGTSYFCEVRIGLLNILAFGIATACGLDDRGVGVRVPVGYRIFTSPI
jgi:hypothetical protein